MANEKISKGLFYRRCLDAAEQLWERISFWTAASDVECDDGNTVENKVGSIKGITTSTNVTETGYAADAKTVSALNSSLTNLNSRLDTKNGGGSSSITLANAIKAYLTTTNFPTNSTIHFYTNSTEGYYDNTVSRSTTTRYTGICMPQYTNTHPPYYVQGEIGGADTVTPFKSNKELTFMLRSTAISGGTGVLEPMSIDTANYNTLKIIDIGKASGYSVTNQKITVNNVAYTTFPQTIDVSNVDKTIISMYNNGSYSEAAGAPEFYANFKLY